MCIFRLRSNRSNDINKQTTNNSDTIASSVLPLHGAVASFPFFLLIAGCACMWHITHQNANEHERNPLNSETVIRFEFLYKTHTVHGTYNGRKDKSVQCSSSNDKGKNGKNKTLKMGRAFNAVVSA